MIIFKYIIAENQESEDTAYLIGIKPKEVL